MQFDSGAASPVNGYPMGEFDRMKMKAAATRRAAEEVKDRQNPNCDDTCADWGNNKDKCMKRNEMYEGLLSKLFIATGDKSFIPRSMILYKCGRTAKLTGKIRRDFI